MVTTTNVVDLGVRRDERARDGWLRELASVQELSLERLHIRDLDWNRLGDAAEEAALLLATISLDPDAAIAA